MVQLVKILGISYLLLASAALACPKQYFLNLGQPSPRPRFTLITYFKGDLKEGFVKELANRGYVADPTDSFDELMYKSLSLRARIIAQKNWNVQTSKALAGRTLSPATQQGLDLLIEKAQKGEDLVPHMSKRIADPEYNDGMFNDWKIYHFHLGTSFDPTGKFIQRTNDLAFVMTNGMEFYILDVLPHAGSFTSKDLLEIAHQQWPEILESSKLNLSGMTLAPEGIALTDTSEKIAKLRKRGITTFYQMSDGTVYMPPGGGYMWGGQSATVMRQKLILTNHYQRVEDLVKKNENVIRQSMEAKKIKAPETLRIKLLSLSQTEAIIEEEKTGFRLRFFIP